MSKQKTKQQKKIQKRKQAYIVRLAMAGLVAALCFVGFKVLNVIRPETTFTDTDTAQAENRFPDMNGDRFVDIIDLSYLLARWRAVDPSTDVTGDNIVDIFDLSKLLSKWQQTAPAVVGFSTYQSNKGLLANEINVATNGNWTWPTTILTNGSDRFATTMKASRIVSGKYYLSSVFGFVNYSRGGYIGMQTSLAPMDGSPQGGIFSVWDTTVAEAVDGGIAQPFSGEGVGMQTMRAMSWSTGTEYELIIERDAARSDGQYNWWRGYFVGKQSQAGIEIGRIRTPAAWGYIVPRTTFVERYGGSNTCGAIERASGDFTDLKARAGGRYYYPSSVRVEIRTYNDCSGIVSANSVANGYAAHIDPGF